MTCKQPVSSLPVCALYRVQKGNFGRQYRGLPMSDFRNFTCNGPVFTQGSLSIPKA
jgi:hypothetical protein